MYTGLCDLIICFLLLFDFFFLMPELTELYVNAVYCLGWSWFCKFRAHLEDTWEAVRAKGTMSLAGSVVAGKGEMVAC